ncbi:unnamed protein product [Rotaria socialis]|uniref:Uncharacterized protein n=1 Tax=Rotaria socialis TaxID=392032 RepID=A0A817RWI3_9BILA|nr:unnamed protein product [Rotaria socialis]CAF3264730.1 unnamed protein product [Rotaria socialis]CAF4157302.1 unnamed protein product [Rotaria socialis]CAF4298630.1 unnamed protein product [Rotaria socialis]
MNNYVLLYTDPHLCIDYIKTIVDENIILIICASLHKLVLPIIHSLNTVCAIFLTCNDRLQLTSACSEYPKVVAICTDQQQLIKSIHGTIQSMSNQTMSFTLFDSSKQNSTRDSASILWYRLLIDILKILPHTDQSKNEMLDKCAEFYRFNEVELQKIETFRTSYTASKAIEWYTSECFLYKLLNKALRTEDIDLLYIFRFYIIDLYSQLELEHHKQFRINNNWDKLIVYRGQLISKDEFKRMKENLGMRISINSFMSTSEDINVALAFIAGIQDSNNWYPILCEIVVDYKLKNAIFADISKLSVMKHEKEILFGLGTVCRIISVIYDEALNLWKMIMEVTDDDLNNVEDFVNLKKNEMQSYSSTIVFGRLLFFELGQTEKAQNYFQKLLNTLPDDHEDISSVYHNLGNIFRQKKEFNLALNYYVTAYNLRQKRFCRNHTHIASSLRNIGLTYQAKKDYDHALDYLTDALTIEQTVNSDDHENIAVTMEHIGNVYRSKKEYQLALTFLLNAYDMYHRILPGQHPDIAWAAGNIGVIFEEQGDYDRALHYYYHAWDIDEKILNSDHQDLTIDFNRIVTCLVKKLDYTTALTFCNQKLTDQNLKLPENHPRNGYTMKTIGCLFRHKKDFNQALHWYQKSLYLFQRCLPQEQEPIIECLIVISQLYYEYNVFHDALETRQRALSLQSKLYTSDHIDIASSLLFIGQLYRHTKNYDQALVCFNQCLKIYQANYGEEHVDITHVRNEIELTANQMNEETIVGDGVPL